MRLNDIIQFGMRYAVFGCIAAIIVIAAFLIGYKLIYQKRFHGTKKIDKWHFIWLVLLVIYCVVLIGATFLSRGEYYTGAQIMPPFASYKEAWYQGKISNIRNIVINILLFMPLGFLLPLGLKRLRKFSATASLGLLITIVIELLQIVTKRGIFEFDDILNNFLGTTIGYGIFVFITWICAKDKKDTLSKMLSCQIPLLLVITAIISSSLVYEKQELGNLAIHYITKVPSKSFEISNSLSLDSKTNKAYVYQVKEYSLSETKELAEMIMQKAGAVINDNETDIYDETVYYRGDRRHVNIDFKGGLFDYINFDSSFSDGKLVEKADASQEEVITALGEIGITIPDGVIFENSGEGQYTFTANCLAHKDVFYDGHISCTLMSDNSIAKAYNKIYACTKYKEYDLISEEQAFQKIKDGKFQLYYPNSNKAIIEIKNISLGYMLDSKTYYQPVYLFDALIDGNEYQIQIPAIKY